jgi:CheY-like chemotaxis protein
VSQEPAPEQQNGPHSRTILFVEDDFSARCTVAECLRETGYRVIEAGNAAEGVSVLSCGTRVDLVFTDINMPGDLDGHAFARWIAKYHPTLPILLTSGASRDVDTIASGRARRFIAKPYDMAEVARQIEEMLTSTE